MSFLKVCSPGILSSFQQTLNDGSYTTNRHAHSSNNICDAENERNVNSHFAAIRKSIKEKEV